jgi:hypothetical protein
MTGTRDRRVGARRVSLALLALGGALGCGLGEGAIYGIGNSGNEFGAAGLVDDVARALAESEATPEVTDPMLGQVFDAIWQRARQGDAEAALIVLQVAQEQREEDD